MRIAYLINQYPAISHTFIRREIRALEDMGVKAGDITDLLTALRTRLLAQRWRNAA